MNNLVWTGLLAVVLVGLACVGCGRGAVPLWSQANPQTSISINPITRTISCFSNDGKTLSAERIYAKWDGHSIEVVNLRIEDRSVENRTANVQQLDMAGRVTQTAVREIFAGVASWLREGIAPLRGASAEIDTPIGSGTVELGGSESNGISVVE